jgi:competence protein ComEA
MKISISKIIRRSMSMAAVAALVVAMGGTWMTTPSAAAAPPPGVAPPSGTAGPVASVVAVQPGSELAAKKSNRKDLGGKLNLNTATEAQLMLLPSVGPSKAERIVVWRKKNGGFKRIADLRRVKGFGYRTFKRLEPFLDIKGDTTLAAK